MKEKIAKLSSWFRQHKLRWLLLLILGVLLLPRQAKPQLLPDSCCPILSAGLATIADLLRTVVGRPLGEIRQIQDEINRFE